MTMGITQNHTDFFIKMVKYLKKIIHIATYFQKALKNGEIKMSNTISPKYGHV